MPWTTLWPQRIETDRWWITWRLCTNESAQLGHENVCPSLVEWGTSKWDRDMLMNPGAEEHQYIYESVAAQVCRIWLSLWWFFHHHYQVFRIVVKECLITHLLDVNVNCLSGIVTIYQGLLQICLPSVIKSWSRKGCAAVHPRPVQFWWHFIARLEANVIQRVVGTMMCWMMQTKKMLRHFCRGMPLRCYSSSASTVLMMMKGRCCSLGVSSKCGESLNLAKFWWIQLPWEFPIYQVSQSTNKYLACYWRNSCPA